METIEHLRNFVARAFLEQSYRRFNAHRIGVGYKRVGGAFTDTLSVVFVVHTKLARDVLDPRVRIPETLRLIDPATGEETAAYTDVVALPPAQLQMFVPGAFNRPAPGGSRIYPQSDSSSAGTLGGWVWDKTDDSIVLLSNRHVLGSNIGEAINQGSFTNVPDGGTLRIGAVKRAADLVQLVGQPPFPESQCSYADATIGSVDNTGDIGLLTPEIGLAVFATARVSLNRHVEMYGSITQYRRGVITMHVPGYVFPIEGQDAGICDLFQFEPLEPNGEVSAQGDSGKLVFNINEDDEPNPCVGLHFAGGGTAAGNNNYGLACPIQNVFDALDLDTLCSGGFAAFLDALFGDAVGGAGAARAVTMLQSRSRMPGFFKGISREVEARLNATERGRMAVGAVRRMRGDLMRLALTSGDLPRMAAATIAPIVAGATTVDQLFARTLSASDAERLGILLDLLDRQGNDRVKSATADLRRLLADATNKTIGHLV